MFNYPCIVLSPQAACFQRSVTQNLLCNRGLVVTQSYVSEEEPRHSHCKARVCGHMFMFKFASRDCHSAYVAYLLHHCQNLCVSSFAFKYLMRKCGSSVAELINVVQTSTVIPQRCVTHMVTTITH